VVSFDALAAEACYNLEPRDELTPERVFERAWTTTLLERAASRLREEYTVAGKTDLYECLTDFRLDALGQPAYAEAAARLQLSESAVKSVIHRLRQRHHQLVREEIAQTVVDPTELEDEIRHLLNVVAG
jgi:RNA polymerase sigma-70 factor (ECF subfamily)